MKKAQEQDRGLVVDILTNSFLNLKNQNSITYVVKQDHKKQKRTRYLMEFLFDYYKDQNHIYLSENNKAVLIVSISNEETVTLKKISLQIQLVFKTIGLLRVFKILRRQNIIKSFYPKENFVKPVILAVDSSAQNKGIGARLVLQVLKANRDISLPVLLDTATKENVKFYSKFGFELLSETKKLGYPFYFLYKKA